MTNFRLNLARQKGEQIAEKHGFQNFPIDPFMIAKNENIHVKATPPEQEGVSGFIVFTGEGVGIGYSTKINNIGLQRFTVAHELGHYFLEGHPDKILKSGGHHTSRAEFTQSDSFIELEADHFASGLLMPTSLVKKVIENAVLGLEGIMTLSNEAESSLTASAIRVAECATFPIAIVVSKGSEICYCFMSDSFKSLGNLNFLRKGDPIPESATFNFNKEESNITERKSVCKSTTLTNWFDGSVDIPLDEEVIGLGHYGFTLTVLSTEQSQEDFCEEYDEEQELRESWTPQFSYRK